MPFDDARGHAIVQGRAQPCAKPARQNPQIDAGIQNMASGFSHRQLSHSRSVDVLHPIGCSPTASHTAHIGRAWRCLLRACRRSDEVSGHEGKRVPRWCGAQGGPSEACHAKPASSPGHESSRSEHPPIGCSPTASHTAHIGRAWRCLLRACRRSYEVRVHERIGYRAGTGRREDHPKRAMPNMPRHQATRASFLSDAKV